MPASRRLGAVITAAVLLTTTACGSGPSGGSDTSAADLNIGIPTAAPAAGDNNPFLMSSAASRLGYGRLIYEPLVLPDPARPTETGIPWLANAWTWSPDGTTLTVTVRDRVRFSDGRPLTGSDVAYTFGLLRAHPELNPDAIGYRDITADGNTVTITFAPAPDTHRADILGTEIVPEHIWSTMADPTAQTVPDPVGTGPFTFAGTDGRSVVLDVWTGYWRALPKIQRIRYTAYPDDDAQDVALLSGDTDWSSVPPPVHGSDHLRQWSAAPDDGGTFSVRSWAGWPDARNPYASARPTDPTALAVVLRLTPAL